MDATQQCFSHCTEGETPSIQQEGALSQGYNVINMSIINCCDLKKTEVPWNTDS
jgi:hypothetical protein